MSWESRSAIMFVSSSRRSTSCSSKISPWRQSMLDGPSVAAALKRCGITHVVWIPDTELGACDVALSSEPALSLVRVCREGEAFAVAAGLHLGGKKSIILLQCTGLFEAGDSLRNILF